MRVSLISVLRKRITNPAPRPNFFRRTPKKEYKNKRNYHVREKYETYSCDKIIEILNVCDKLAYYAGVVDTLEEIKGQGSLEKNLIDTSKQAKLTIPKKIYDQPEIQQYVNKIKQGISYFNK